MFTHPPFLEQHGENKETKSERKRVLFLPSLVFLSLAGGSKCNVTNFFLPFFLSLQLRGSAADMVGSLLLPNSSNEPVIRFLVV